MHGKVPAKLNHKSKTEYFIYNKLLHFPMFKRNGQAAAGAAVLVFIIAGLIIGFIILIPPQERAALLNEPLSSSSSNIDSTAALKVLLIEEPGRVDYISQKEIEHPLPAINIFTKTQSNIIAEKNLAIIKNGVFTEDNAEFPFEFSDFENTKNVLVSFTIVESDGPVVVWLNGVVVFQEELLPGAVQPITLPKNMLKEQNILTFSMKSPGIAFWKTHSAQIDKIKIVADVTTLDAQSSTSVFLISEAEFKNLDRSILRFQPSCKLGNVGKMKITVNGDEIFNSIPNCDLQMVPIEFSPALLLKGKNEITFFTEKGTYLLFWWNLN